MSKKFFCFSHFLLFVYLSIMFICCGKTSPQTAGAEPEWTTDFEAGAAADLRYRKDGSIGFSIPEDPGDSQYLWFYFKVFNCGGDPLEFVLENAAGAHQTGKRWNITRPLFSADGRTWVRAEETRYANPFGLASKLGLRPVFRFRSPIIADTLWVAYSYPYTSRDLKAFLETIKDSKGVAISVLGKSEEGRDIVRVQITGDQLPDKEKKQSIWIVGREHPGETPVSYFCEGMIGALLHSVAGRQLRRVFDFTFVPMLNIDGVARGYYYHNTSGVNLARDWVEFKSTEARAVRDGLIEDIQNKGVRLLINLHSSNDPMKGHFFLVIPPDKLKREDAEFQKRLLKTSHKRHPQLQGHSTVSLYSLPGITGNALYRDFGLYSFYIESNYSRGADASTVTSQSLQETGVALVEALAEVIVSE